MQFLERRRLRKRVREALRHATHVRHMREDLLSEADLGDLVRRQGSLRDALGSGDVHRTEQEYEGLCGCMNRLMPSREPRWLRENVEIVVVALSVAMGFRTYFVQPFKIPTGSMEPTLYGIHCEEANGPSLTDRVPLKFVKWAITGEWYREVRVGIPGYVGRPYGAGQDRPASCYYDVGPRRYELHKSAEPRIRPGTYAEKGDLLWAGRVITGDHVFVDKVRWNFARPKRGQIVVFATDKIAGIGQDTHYIKRLIGLPNESIGIEPPHVLVNGKRLTGPAPIMRVQNRAGGRYQGYKLALANPVEPAILTTPDSRMQLGPADYLALGDNTGNSRDGRYWGPVPQPAMVGPAFMVYWPASSRWGPTK